MSEFGDFVTTDATAGGFGSDDPTADFLAREQAVLGADAALFGNDYAGTPVASTPAGFGAFDAAPSGGNGFDAGGFGDASGGGPVQNNDAFGRTGFDENAFPSDLNLAAAVPLPFNNTGVSSSDSYNPGSAVEAPREPEAEPEVIKEWREGFANLVADRDAKSKKKHEDMLNQAKEALERFYADYNEKKNKSISRNKDQEKKAIAEREDTTSGTVWRDWQKKSLSSGGGRQEGAWKWLRSGLSDLHLDTLGILQDRVVKQIESVEKTSSAASTKGKVDLTKGRLTTNPDDKNKDKKDAKPATKLRDTARMKQLLLSLRKDPKAPGVEILA
ncbi:hypothetical protein HKX48_008625 [Thoreauomyces humboldtii]|nr:hypothetical protein HKX48_008625 [Thoreauomyces humboldtii]